MTEAKQTASHLRKKLRSPKLWVGLATVIIVFHLLFTGRVNHLRATNAWHGDEGHTVRHALLSLETHKIQNWRLLEGSRWITRAFYPYALIKTVQDTGGTPWVKNWDDIGHHYILKHIQATAPNQDPIMRRFLFYLRMQDVALVAFSFLVLSVVFIQNEYYLAALGVPLGAGLSLNLLEEQSILYVEPSMLAWINFLLAWMLYALLHPSRLISRKECWLLGFFSALGVSLKLSLCFFTIAPLVVFILCRQSRARVSTLILHWGLSFVLSFAAINILAFRNPNQMLHDITSNFWQYANGSRPAGWEHFKFFIYTINEDLGYLPVLAPFLLGIALIYASKSEKKYLAVVLGIFAITLLSLISQHIWLTRNYVPMISMISLLTLLPADIIARYWLRQDLCRGVIVYAGLAVLLGGAGLVGVFAANRLEIRHRIYPDYKEEFLQRIGKLAKEKPKLVITEDTKVLSIHADVPDLATTSLAEGDIPQYIRHSDQKPASYRINHEQEIGFQKACIFSYLEQVSKIVQGYDVVIVREFKNRSAPENNHLVRFVLPKQYQNSEQSGDYHVFWNPADSND